MFEKRWRDRRTRFTTGLSGHFVAFMKRLAHKVWILRLWNLVASRILSILDPHHMNRLLRFPHVEWCRLVHAWFVIIRRLLLLLLLIERIKLCRISGVGVGECCRKW